MHEFEMPTQSKKDYSHRTTVQKLGVKPGDRIEVKGDVPARACGRTSRRQAVAASSRAVSSTARSWPSTRSTRRRACSRPTASRLKDSGYLWLITRKRGHENYLNQMLLVPFGKACGMIDNKTCSVDDTARGSAGSSCPVRSGAWQTATAQQHFDERLHHHRIELSPGGLSQLRHRVVLLHRRPIRTVRGHGVECVHHEDDPRSRRDLLAPQAVGYPPPSQRSWSCRTILTAQTERARGSAHRRPCSLTISNSSVVRADGLLRTASGTAILPMSCRIAPSPQVAHLLKSCQA